MRKWMTLSAGLFLSPLAAGEEIRDLRVEVEEGTPAKVRVQGSASLPDRLILSISIKTQRTDIHGAQWRLLEMFRVPVQNGAIEKTFSFEKGLSFGPYKVEVDCDKGHQYPGVEVPKDVVHAEASFKVAFTDDIAAPLRGYVDAHAALTDLWNELEAKFASLSARAKDPAALEEWKRFAEPWSARISKLASEVAPQEELLYPDLRLALSGLSNKIQLFRQDHECMIEKGEHCEIWNAHKNWFEPDPSVDLVSARARLAQEFAFNVGKKVVDYGYDKATGILAQVKGAGSTRAWDLFRTPFGQDLDRMEKAYQDLASGSCKDEIAEIAADVPAMLKAGRDLLAAGDLEAAEPGKGSGALGAVKDALKKAYVSIQDRIKAAEAKRMARQAPAK